MPWVALTCPRRDGTERKGRAETQPPREQFPLLQAKTWGSIQTKPITHLLGSPCIPAKLVTRTDRQPANTATHFKPENK